MLAIVFGIAFVVVAVRSGILPAIGLAVIYGIVATHL